MVCMEVVFLTAIMKKPVMYQIFSEKVELVVFSLCFSMLRFARIGGRGGLTCEGSQSNNLNQNLQLITRSDF